MAEVFGVVVSALTVAEMAGKFGASIVKLKKLWDEVQDVPNEIAHLFRQLEILRPVLAEMEAEFSQRTHRVHHDSAANLSMEYCQQAVGELDALAEELQSRINAARRSRRHITKLKVTFRKEQIQAYQDKIRFALQLLALSQQTYTISLVKSRPLIQEGSSQSTAANQSIQSEIIVGSPQVRQNMCSGPTSWRSMASMRWRKASFFGAFVYQTTSDPSHPDIQVHQARVQLPWWISETVWDFQAQRACSGWKVLLKTWIMRPYDAPIFRHVENGSWSDILVAFSRGEASLQDVNTNGWTLLHVWPVSNSIPWTVANSLLRADGRFS
ncbi:hypothetical protein CDEST_06271 [Colletotrichum destructivum]|uniref:Fungal N-terminal domain-containing protein n=1 Tax=Colletotrichum destructivum TaxID=34406 RepID=A0AAX4IDF5_9PEZI|nr:hypothetical protein CDEST_06271 [Colletotrichum destructivum]